MVLTVTEFIGHLHPVLIHLPIGILLLACLFLWLSRKEKFKHLQSALHIILLSGMISAILSCLSGYLLSLSGDYDENMVQLHQWLGISVAIFSIAAYFLYVKNILVKWLALTAILLGLLLVITGHMGGSLTHGSDYLTKPLENLSGDDTIAIIKRKPIPDIQQAMVYADVVEPIFQSKCYSCHSTIKQKGKLRLDQVDLIMKGGKDGLVIVPGKANESDLIKRISSPREEEHHMPPKEKTQLNEKEKALLQWWVNQGADFTKKVKDVQQPEKIKPLLLDLQNAEEVKKYSPALPIESVGEADGKTIQLLKGRGIVILPVAQNSHYLSANFITATDFGDKEMHLLLPLKKQLIWLKIGHTIVTDSALFVLTQFKNLTELDLNHTRITDKGLDQLKTIANLQSLNLVGTKITAGGLLKLTSLKKLHFIYLYQSAVDKKDWVVLQNAFPKSILDSGGYKMKYIESDTQVVKPPKLK